MQRLDLGCLGCLACRVHWFLLFQQDKHLRVSRGQKEDKVLFYSHGTQISAIPHSLSTSAWSWMFSRLLGPRVVVTPLVIGADNGPKRCLWLYSPISVHSRSVGRFLSGFSQARLWFFQEADCYCQRHCEYFLLLLGC